MYDATSKDISNVSVTFDSLLYSEVCNGFSTLFAVFKIMSLASLSSLVTKFPSLVLFISVKVNRLGLFDSS